jgi:hypothetical protein
MKRLLARWQAQSPSVRNRIATSACVGLTVFYAGLIWPFTHKRLGELEYQQEKQTVRLKSSGKAAAPAAAPDLGGFSPMEARREQQKLGESITMLEAEQQRLDQRFVALDDLESLQALKSELTRLAEAGDMEVQVLEHIYLRKEDRDRPPTVELLQEAAAANPYKRPLLRLKARASYRGLMHFLDGLAGLSHIAAPVWSDIEVNSEKAAPDTNPLRGGNTPKQWLEVEIRLAV